MFLVESHLQLFNSLLVAVSSLFVQRSGVPLELYLRFELITGFFHPLLHFILKLIVLVQENQFLISLTLNSLLQ